MKKVRKTKDKLAAGIYIGFSLCICAFVFSIVQVIHLNDLRYEKTSKIETIKELQDNNEKLAIHIAKLKTSQNLKESALAIGMVEVSNIHYIDAAGTGVAINNR